MLTISANFRCHLHNPVFRFSKKSKISPTPPFKEKKKKEKAYYNNNSKMGLKIDSKNEPVNGCDDAFLSPILEEVKAYMDEIGAQGRETSGVPLGYL